MNESVRTENEEFRMQLPRPDRPLPYLLSCLLLGLALLLPAAAPVRAADGPQPVARVQEPIGDLGDVIEGESRQHVFEVQNEGTAPLTINEVRPTCGCMVTSYDETIPAGGVGKITVDFDTTGLEGGISKMLTVFTSDPANPRIELAIKVKVISFLHFNPGLARFMKAQGFEPGQVTQLFFAEDFKDLKIEKIDSPMEALKVDYRLATEEERRDDAGPGNQYVLTLTFDYNKAPVGPLLGDLLVHTNHPKQEVGRMAVSGFVRPRLAVTPNRADFGEVKLEDEPRARFLVQNFSPVGITVTSAEMGLAGAEAKVTEVEPGRRYHVEFALPDDLPKGAFQTVLKIHTSSKEEPVVAVPVSGTIL